MSTWVFHDGAIDQVLTEHNPNLSAGLASMYPDAIYFEAELVMPDTEQDHGTGSDLPLVPVRRFLSCVEAWPECVDGEYNPACCRFPKPCSCAPSDPSEYPAARLEPTPPGGAA
jgi:hypothetical protein